MLIKVIQRFFYNDPYFSITKEGIYPKYLLFYPGLVKWSEISEISVELDAFTEQRIIKITAKDLDICFKRKGEIRFLIEKALRKIYPINFKNKNTFLLSLPVTIKNRFDDVILEIKKYFPIKDFVENKNLQIKRLTEKSPIIAEEIKNWRKEIDKSYELFCEEIKKENYPYKYLLINLLLIKSEEKILINILKDLLFFITSFFLLLIGFGPIFDLIKSFSLISLVNFVVVLLMIFAGLFLLTISNKTNFIIFSKFDRAENFLRKTKWNSLPFYVCLILPIFLFIIMLELSVDKIAKDLPFLVFFLPYLFLVYFFFSTSLILQIKLKKLLKITSTKIVNSAKELVNRIKKLKEIDKDAARQGVNLTFITDKEN